MRAPAHSPRALLLACLKPVYSHAARLGSPHSVVMVKIGKGPRKSTTPTGKKPQQTPRQQQGGGGGGPQTLKTSKGNFSFQMVADGCYIEHKARATSTQPILRPPLSQPFATVQVRAGT